MNQSHFNMKACIKCCEQKPMFEFYEHPKMADGTLNKCKECCKKYNRMRRVTDPEAIRAIEKRKTQTQKYKYWRTRYQRLQRQANPIKYRARTAVSNAVKCGKLIKQPCIFCKDIKTEAHHPNYEQPLNVVWLCGNHHKEIHAKTELLSA